MSFIIVGAVRLAKIEGHDHIHDEITHGDRAAIMEFDRGEHSRQDR